MEKFLKSLGELKTLRQEDVVMRNNLDKFEIKIFKPFDSNVIEFINLLIDKKLELFSSKINN